MRFITFLLSVVAIVFIGGCTQVLLSKDVLEACKNNPESVERTLESNQFDVSALDNCHYVHAIKSWNLTICDFIDNKHLLTNCYHRVGLVNRDLTACESIRKLWANDFSGNQCFRAIAEALYDETVCDKVSDKVDKKLCIDKASSRPKLKTSLECEQKSEIEKKICYYLKAAETNDLGYCNYPGTSTYEGCIYVVAGFTNNLKLCELISGRAEVFMGRGACISCFVSEITKTPSLCETLSTAEDRDFCYLEVFTSDIKICNKIENPEKRNVCVTNIEAREGLTAGNVTCKEGIKNIICKETGILC